MQIRHTTDLTSPIYQAALAIRKTVFVAEQHVPVAREVDADEARTIHFVAYANDQPVGTARLLPEATGFHVQRVAVVKAARGTGVGSALLQAWRITPRPTTPRPCASARRCTPSGFTSGWAITSPRAQSFSMPAFATGKWHLI